MTTEDRPAMEEQLHERVPSRNLCRGRNGLLTERHRAAPQGCGKESNQSTAGWLAAGDGPSQRCKLGEEV
jgi:hypothetical protein